MHQRRLETGRYRREAILEASHSVLLAVAACQEKPFASCHLVYRI
jgi:hypothetical protein